MYVSYLWIQVHFQIHGIGGVGLVIQDPSMAEWIQLEYPIDGITTCIGSEIEAIKIALEYVSIHYQQGEREERVIILSDCKFAVNSILNKWDPDMYKLQVNECQKIMQDMGDENVPELHWIKGHSGIPGNWNEKADQVAKRARE